MLSPRPYSIPPPVHCESRGIVLGPHHLVLGLVILSSSDVYPFFHWSRGATFVEEVVAHSLDVLGGDTNFTRSGTPYSWSLIKGSHTKGETFWYSQFGECTHTRL